MFAAEARGELPKGTARRWAHETDDIKKLPEHVKKKRAEGVKEALAAFGLTELDELSDKTAGAKQLLRAYEATRRLNPSVATPGALSAREAFNAMAKTVGGHSKMPQALTEVGHPLGITQPLPKRGLRRAQDMTKADVLQQFARPQIDQEIGAAIPARERKALRRQVLDFHADPYGHVAGEIAQFAGGSKGYERHLNGLGPEAVARDIDREVQERQQMYRDVLPYLRKRPPAPDPRDIHEAISGRHIPKGVDRASAVLVDPRELPHEPYSVHWKGGVPAPRNTAPDTAMWTSGYPTIAGGYAMKKAPRGATLRAYPIDPKSPPRYTPHVAQDVRDMPREALQKLTQRAGQSDAGALPHYEQVVSHKDLGMPVAMFKPVPGTKKFQQVLGEPMPRVGRGVD